MFTRKNLSKVCLLMGAMYRVSIPCIPLTKCVRLRFLQGNMYGRTAVVAQILRLQSIVQTKKLKLLNKKSSKYKSSVFFLKLRFWDSLNAGLNSHLGMELQEKKHKKIKAYRKSDQKRRTVKRCLLTLDLKPLRLQVN